MTKDKNLNTSNNRSSFQFNDPVLKESMFTINSNFDNSREISSRERLKIETGASQPELKNDIFSSNVVVKVSNFNTTSTDLGDDIKHPFFISVVMSATFRWSESSNFDENNVKYLLGVNAPSLILSYIRSHVTNLTSITEIPTQFIPFIDFTKANNKK